MNLSFQKFGYFTDSAGEFGPEGEWNSPVMENDEIDLRHLDAYTKKQIEGIINSMTVDERTNPDLIDRSRRNRIARGSGTDPSDVNGLLKQFNQMKKMMKMMKSGKMKRLQKMMGKKGGMGGFPGGGFPGKF